MLWGHDPIPLISAPDQASIELRAARIPYRYDLGAYIPILRLNGVCSDNLDPPTARRVQNDMGVRGRGTHSIVSGLDTRHAGRITA